MSEQKTAKPILAVAGDLHISNTVYRSRLLDMQGDALWASIQIADYCAARRLDLILAGDILDTKRPESADVKALQDIVTKVEDSGCSVYGIQGQHDISNPPWMEVVGATHLTLAGCRIGAGDGLGVIGLDYHNRAELLEMLAEVTPCDILILHQMVKESLGYAVELGIDGEEHEVGPNYDVSLEEMPSHVKLVIAADNHSGYSCEDIEGVPDFSYTGSTHMRSIDEPPGKHFLVVHDDFSIHRVSLDTRPFRKFEVVSEERLRDCLKEIRELIEAQESSGADQRPYNVGKPFVVIRFDPAVERVPERVKAACEDKAFYKILPYQTVAQIGEETEVVKGSVTLEGCLDEVVDPEGQPELNTFVRDLLQAEDPRLVIAKTKDNFLQEVPAVEAIDGGT